jgi:hypothetical protein
MTAAFTAVPGVDVITAGAEIPTLGCLAINAFVVHGSEPILVDTGTVAGRDEFRSALDSVIDPSTLRWIWLTHTDFDHIGSLADLVAEHPKIRVITSFLGTGIMGLSATPLPMDRVRLVNAGETVVLPDRTLRAFRPPVFDNPVTTGFFDDRTKTLFTSDCFGSLLPQLAATSADLDPDVISAGQVRWATIDSAWVHDVDRRRFAANLDRLRATEPAALCSAHLPPAPGSMLGSFLDALSEAPDAPPYTGIDHASFEAMLAEMGAPVP